MSLHIIIVLSSGGVPLRTPAFLRTNNKINPIFLPAEINEDKEHATDFYKKS